MNFLAIFIAFAILIASYRKAKNNSLCPSQAEIKKAIQNKYYYITALCFAALYALTVGDTLTTNKEYEISIHYWSWFIFTIISFMAVIGIAIFVNEITSSNKSENCPEQRANSAQPTPTGNSKPNQPKSH